MNLIILPNAIIWDRVVLFSHGVTPPINRCPSPSHQEGVDKVASVLCTRAVSFNCRHYFFGYLSELQLIHSVLNLAHVMDSEVGEHDESSWVDGPLDH